MCVAIDLLNSKLSVIGDHRKTVVACFALLLERSNDVRIHRTIFETVKGWVFDNTAPVLTTKEKCAMVQKFAILERRTDRELFEDYLNLAIRVYETEAFVRSEMTVVCANERGA